MSPSRFLAQQQPRELNNYASFRLRQRGDSRLLRVLPEDAIVQAERSYGALLL